MEFSYRITEADCLNAAKLKLKGAFHLGRIGKNIMFWVVILVSLMVAISFVQTYRDQPPISDEVAVQTVAPAQLFNATIMNVLPFVVFVSIILYVIFRGVPMQLRRQYRKNPAMHGQFTVNMTTESISIHNTAGTSSRTGWNIYDYWREGKGLILLVFHSGAFFSISLADLSEVQKDELRGILAAALPKK
jgi:hypothetical protein